MSHEAPIAVPVRRLPGHEDLPLPAYQSEGAAAMDVAAAVAEPVALAPGGRCLIPTGLALAVPPGYEAQIRPRSGLAVKHGITVANAPGTIDADYRGEVKIALLHLGEETLTIERGMRVAQLLIQRVPRVTWREVPELPETARGAGGFGHTG